MKTYKIENGALVEVPVYEQHQRGKNWMAIISSDPKAPGGLRREFLERARGKFYYMVEGLEVGDPIEFGADYYSGSGRKHANRVYGVVVSLTSDALNLEECATADEAMRKSQEIRERDITPIEIPVSDDELSKFSDSELIAELQRRGYTVNKAGA